MANNYSQILEEYNSGKKMGLSNTITRDLGIPLDFSSVHASYNDAVIYAATKKIAYEGQMIAADGKAYIIVSDSQGELEIGDGEEKVKYNVYLKELGTQAAITGLTARLETVEKFFEEEGVNPELVETLKELQDYITEHGNSFTGLLNQVNYIYKPETKNEDGTIKEKASGLLLTIKEEVVGLINAETSRAKEKEQFALDLLFGKNNVYGTDEEIDGVIVHTPGYVEDLQDKIGTNDFINGVLGDFRGKKADGTFTYNTVADFVRNATSTATTNKLGGVLSSSQKGHDLVEVIQDNEPDSGITAGQMRVIDLNVNKLYQTDYLILDGGTAQRDDFNTANENISLEDY